MRAWVRLLLATLVLTLLGCGATRERIYFLGNVTSKERPETYLGMPLQSGQLVLSEAPGAYSFMFGLGTERFFDFTHAGVLVMEDGQPFVYDMSGEYGCGVIFADRPSDAIEGGCRRTPLMEYARANLYVEIFDPPPGADGAKIAAWVQRQYREQPPFDAYFDWKDEEKLFCTQFVQHAVVAGGGAKVPLEKIRQHPGLLRLLNWFKLATDFNIPAGLFADPKRYVAALGQFPCRRAAYCYFAAKRELHRRFTNDQALGNLFELEGWADIRLRPEIIDFTNKALRLFPVSRSMTPQAEIDAKVRKLARQMFGEGPPPAPAKAEAKAPTKERS